MDNYTTLKFKEIFEKQKANLIYTQNIINDDFNLNKDDILDDIDKTSSELEASMRIRLRSREALFLKKIDNALYRISQGTYGKCMNCKEDIELKRLQARPTATLCLNCKENQEHEESSNISGQQFKSLGKGL